MADKNERICIIGGGPAGTSMAMYLEKNGYNNYVIYEKTNRVGGKAFSPLMFSKIQHKEYFTMAVRTEEGNCPDISYYFFENMTNETRDTTIADMAKCKLPVEKTERIDDWYYFPHVNSADYADGWYDKVEAMQGVDNTYYAGEIMSFGDMEETAEYSRDVVARFFKK